MSRNNKKIVDAKKRIKEEKKIIRLEKKKEKKKRYDKFRKTKLGKVLFNLHDESNNYSRSSVFVISIISLFVGVGICLSVSLIIFGGRNYFKLSNELGKFYDVYEVMRDNYYEDISSDELINSAISGMVANVGDSYTGYSGADTTSAFDELVSGIYEGIGVTIQKVDDGVKVISLFEDSPSDKAGIKVGDIIYEIDSIDISEKSLNEVSDYIKNKASKEINLFAKRGDEEIKFKVKRDKVEIPAVSGKIYSEGGKKIGYIDISLFSSVSSGQFKSKLEELEKDNIDALVIDVRDNNGGYLSSVTEIASYLLPKGKVIYQIQKDNKKEVTKDKTSSKREYPIAILTNENSASASEILAGAIKESYLGYVVGTKTFGKGTVQQVKKLKDGSMIKYTVENWLTPNGNWIDDVGIEPTDLVDLDSKYYDDPIDENDNQLQKAIELVSK